MKRIIFLIYGIVAYVIFFGTFCFAAGFVSRLIVPGNNQGNITCYS